MRRTITIENGHVYYLGKEIDYLLDSIRSHFGLKNSRIYKYVISIVESKTGRYNVERSGAMDDMYALYEIEDGAGSFVGEICQEHFVKIFFRPWLKKRYNITVKKVRIKK